MKLFKRKAAADNANLIMLSDGTYREKGRKDKIKKKKKTTKKSTKSSTNSSKKKRGGLFSRKSKKSAPKQQSSKILQAVTLQYPGIPRDRSAGCVELDLSFETAATTDTHNELDQFLAELEATPDGKDDKAKPEEAKSTSFLGWAFPSVFDEEGYLRCGCGPPEDVNADDLTVTLGNKSSDKEEKPKVNTVTTSTPTDNNGDHAKAKDVPKTTNATPSTSSGVITESPKVNVAYVCNPSQSSNQKAKGSAIAKAAEAKGAVAAARTTATSKPPLHPSNRKKPTSLAKPPSRIIDKGEFSGPVSCDAFYTDEEPDDEESKKEVEQITRMENYRFENESLKAEIQRLKHLKVLEEENESLKAEVLKLQKGMGVVKQIAQNMKEGGGMKDKDPAQVQKQWEEGWVTGMFVRLANLFDDDGFIKCMTPSEDDF